MVKKLLSSFFVTLIIHSISISADIGDLLKEYFKEERMYKNSYSRIVVLSKTYGEFNPIGGFADGRYNLVNYYINRIEPNIYLLELYFQKKKGSLRFSHKVYYYFWYDGNIIAFKTIKGKVRYPVPRYHTKVIKRDNSYILKREPAVLRVVLPVERGNVYLYLLFR